MEFNEAVIGLHLTGKSFMAFTFVFLDEAFFLGVLFITFLWYFLAPFLLD